MAEFHEYVNRSEAARALASAVAAHLRERTAAATAAALVVSGGRSPIEFFRYLRAETLAWDRVNVIPSDERWVPIENDDSNEGLIRRELLVENAADARIVSLYREDASPEDARPAVNRALAAIARPLDHVVLGMGSDGHTASLFPDARNLEAALASGEESVVPDLPAASPARFSLSLRYLCDARAIDLLIFGDDKREVLEAARTSADPLAYPVAGVLRDSRAPVRVFWAP